MVSGIPLVLVTPSSSPYETLAFFSLWALFTLFLTTALFWEGSNIERTAFILSFSGGYLMLLVPIYVVLSRYPIVPLGSCADFYPSLGYACGGTPASEYYSYVNLLTLAGMSAVTGSLLYATHRRAYIISVPVGLLSWGFFLFTALPTEIPLVIPLLCSPAAAGGFLNLKWVRRKHGGEPEQGSLGQMFKVLTRGGAAVVMLTILATGVIGGLWGYATQAAGSVQVSCEKYSFYDAIALNGTVELRNPSYLPLDGVWEITYTYNYSGSRIVLSDTESFHIAPKGEISVSFVFPGSTQYPRADSDITTVYQRHYKVLLWSFEQTSLAVEPVGLNYGPPNPHPPVCSP